MSEDRPGTLEWYVVHTYSGYENKVKQNLEQIVKNRGMEDVITDIRIPTETVVESDGSRDKEVESKIMPAYVFIKMVMTDETWHIVRNITGVTGFVGPGSKPVPLTDAEMKSMGIKVGNISVDFAEGDTITVIAGPWKDTVGMVQRMDVGKQTATINVDLFGRETPVEIGFEDMRKLS